MWFNGDYRVVIRYENWYDYRDSFEWGNSVYRAMCKMYGVGLLNDAIGSMDGKPHLTPRALDEVERVTVVVLQKKVREGDLEAWHTFTIGYAFCQARDQFSKKIGRQIAFERALKQIKNDTYRKPFEEIYAERVNTSE
jgi:hypothetical protein